MKKIWILMILTVIGCCAAACPAQAADEPEVTETAESAGTSENTQKASNKTVKKGLVRENGHTRYYKKGEPVCSTWKTVDGERYYFNAKGNAVTYGAKINGKRYVFSRKGRLLHPSKNKVVKVGSYRYYVSTKGRALSGWVLQGGKLYYAKASGRCLKSTKYRGISFTEDSWAKTDSYATKAKIKAMEIVKKVTNSGMTQTQKLRACFNYTMSCGFVGRSYPDGWPNLKTGWYYKTGYTMMTSRRGNCYGYASMFALLARELGYSPTIVDARIPGEHCFVKINGKAYDNMGNRFGTAAQKHTVKASWTLKAW